MTRMRPFFLLLGRASVFWLGLFTLAWLSILVATLANPEASVLVDVDLALLSTLAFPTAAGWLFGLVIQELAHTSFAAQLPGVRRRLATGFLTAGIAVSVVTVSMVRLSAAPSLGVPLMLTLALGAYCFGGVLLDPLSTWVTAGNVVVVLLVVTRSRELSRIVAERPWIAGSLSLCLGAAGLWRLFSRGTFRRKPFRLTSPLPGRFSIEKGAEYQRRRLLVDRAKTSDWRTRYLGSRTWAWVRAAHHEVYGPLGWKALARAIGRLWGLALIVLAYAWVDRGDLGFPEAVGYSLFDALIRSPHVPRFGEKGGPFLLVLILIAVVGVLTALTRSVSLSDALFYPLSRVERARVAFYGGLVDAAILLLVLGVGFLLVGEVSGLLAGFEPRFDFMPFCFRVSMVTLILMPLGYWGRFGLQAARRRKAENTIVALVFGVIGYVLAVGLATWLLSSVFSSPAAELALLLGAFTASQLLYRRRLLAHYRTADLG